MKYVNLAFYKKKDWNRFLESIDDRKSMHDTWEEWNLAYQKAKKHLIYRGFIVKDFVVDIDELTAWCKSSGIRNVGKARSQFVTKR